MVVAVTCGDSPPAVESCVSRSLVNRFCIEYQKADPATDLAIARDLCRPPATWVKGPCERSGSLGGCTRGTETTPDGDLTQIVWYYAGDRIKTDDDVKAECAKTSATFVSP